MNVEKRCYLHIGAPKTGSTALQNFLYENRKQLADYGWKYPDVSLRGFGHHDLAFQVAGGYPEWAIPQERSLSELTDNLKATVAGCSQIILSSENFFLFPNPKKIAEILHDAGFSPETVKIVVYVRRQDEAHISWYNQVVKAQGYSGTIGQCIQDNFELWNYQIQLDKWTHVFGSSNIIVRPYEKETLANGDVRRDFLKILDIPQSNLIMPDKMVNTRLNRDILDFQRIINQLPLSSKEKRTFHKELIDLTSCSEATNLFHDEPLLSSAQCNEIIPKYSKSNRIVAQTYIGKEELFDDKLPHSILKNYDSTNLTLEKIVHIFGWIIIKNKQNSLQ
jgi:hypothetical protein